MEANFLMAANIGSQKLVHRTELEVTMYTASSNKSHFSTAGFLVSCTYKARTQLEFTMYSKYTTHISSNRSHFLTDRFFVYCTF